jgi:hypothetical protein
LQFKVKHSLEKQRAKAEAAAVMEAEFRAAQVRATAGKVVVEVVVVVASLVVMIVYA